MAYLRFRGNTTQLLATIWQDGRNKQIVLLNLRGAMSITRNMREVVAANFPDVTVDWPEIERALIAGQKQTKGENTMREGFEDLSLNDLNYAVVNISCLDGDAICYCATSEQADLICEVLKSAGRQVDVYSIHN